MTEMHNTLSSDDSMTENRKSEKKSILKKAAIPEDQLYAAIPAFLYIITPLIDMAVYLYSHFTGGNHWNVFSIIGTIPIYLGIFYLICLLFDFFEKKNARTAIGSIIQRTKTFQNTLLYFMIFLGLVLMSIAVNGFTSFALHGHYYTRMSMWVYITNVCFFLFASSLVYDERVKRFLVKTCVIGAGIYAAFAIWHRTVDPYKGNLSATFYNSNHYGYYLAVTTALCAAMIIETLPHRKESIARRLEGILYIIIMVVLGYSVGANNTMGAWLAIFITHIFLGVVYALRDKKLNKWVIFSLVLFVLSSFITSFMSNHIVQSILKMFGDLGLVVLDPEEADHAGSGRWLIWRLTINHIIDRPLFGNGIEGLLYKITQEGSKFGSPHNEFLEYAAFFGIPAGLMYIVSCFSVFWHGKKYKSELNPYTIICMAGAFSYLASSFFGVCFYYTVTYPFIFMGLALNFTAEDRPKTIPVEADNPGSHTSERSEDAAADSETVSVEKEPDTEEPKKEEGTID